MLSSVASVTAIWTMLPGAPLAEPIAMRLSAGGRRLDRGGGVAGHRRRVGGSADRHFTLADADDRRGRRPPSFRSRRSIAPRTRLPPSTNGTSTPHCEQHRSRWRRAAPESVSGDDVHTRGRFARPACSRPAQKRTSQPTSSLGATHAGVLMRRMGSPSIWRSAVTVVAASVE
jgi:hypothetical protein